MTWTLEGEDARHFSINSSGVLSMTARVYRNPTDEGADNTYRVTVRATDSAVPVTNTTAVAITVTVTPQAPAGCVGRLTGDGSVTGRWSGRYRFGDWIPDCASVERGENYATRYYRLTLAEESRVTLDLRSPDAGTHLYLWPGVNRQAGEPLAEDSGPFWRGSGFSSRIARTLDAGTYTVEATTFAELDDGRFTLSVSGLGHTAPVPSQPTGFAAEKGDNQVRLRWDAMDGVTGWQYEQNGNDEWVDAGDGLATGHTVTGLADPATYRFRVRAVNDTGRGPPSAPLTVTLQASSQCTQRLTGDGTVDGRWAAGCDSFEPGNRHAGSHARWYEFTLAGRREVVIYLRSGAADSYLYLRSGAGARSGTAIASDDDGGLDRDSQIARTLDAGTYTIEATTYAPGRTGEFTLTLSGTGHTEPTPEPPPASEPELRIFDARANEGSPYNSGEMHFRVTLAPAQGGSVGVCYQSRDGTARGDLYGRYGDYEEAYGCMYFAPGETQKYISVRLIGDWHDEGDETFYMVLEDARGAIIADGLAIGTIVNDGPLQREWLSRFGRTVAGQMVEALEGRFALGAGTPSHLTVAGHRVDFSGAPPPRDDLREDRWEEGETRGMDLGELLLGSSFHVTAGEVSGLGAMAGWGKALTGSSSASLASGLALTSETVTGVLGMDFERGDLLVGFALSQSAESGGVGGFAQSGPEYDIKGSLSLVTPYARFKAGERVSVWAMTGTGEGSLSLGYGDERQRAGLAMQAAAGARAELLRPDPEGGGFALALKTDAFFVRTESESVSTPGMGNLAGAVGDASRVRAVLEGSRAFALSGGGAVEPSLSLGLRHDGGDAETGTGVEMGAGLAWSDPALGLTSNLRLYGLAAHEDAGYDEWGVSGSLRIAPGASGRGLSLSMAPAWGAQAQGGRLWSTQPSALVDGGAAVEPPGARLDTELGYGLSLSGGLTGTPYVGLGLGEARDYRLGWRLASGRWQSFSLGIEATRREGASDAAPEHGLGLRLDARF